MPVFILRLLLVVTVVKGYEADNLWMQVNWCQKRKHLGPSYIIWSTFKKSKSKIKLIFGVMTHLS